LDSLRVGIQVVAYKAILLFCAHTNPAGKGWVNERTYAANCISELADLKFPDFLRGPRPRHAALNIISLSKPGRPHVKELP